MKGTIDLLAAAANENDKAQKDVTFNNNSPFRSSISKTNNALIDIAEDLNINMPMYNLLEYSDNYSMISERLWNYHRDEIDDTNDNASEGKSFEYKTKTTGKTPIQPDAEEDDNRENVPSFDKKVTIPFKYLSNVWRSVDLLLTDREAELDLS